MALTFDKVDFPSVIARKEDAISSDEIEIIKELLRDLFPEEYQLES